MAFQTPYDIANRCLDHLGVSHVSSFQGSRNADAVGFVYDKIRRAELRANPWNFARRRAVLRPVLDPTQTFLIALPVWSSTATYNVGDLVSRTAFNGTAFWVCMAGPTSVQPPETGYPWIEYTGAVTANEWVPGTYYAGELVVGNPDVFLNTLNGNTAIPPARYHPVVGATVVPLNLFSPIGYSTNNLSTPKNLFPLPAAYLRNAPQDPKTRSNPYQLSTGGSQVLDYEIEQGFLLSSVSSPIVFRYGADVWLVTWMDDLFCEMMACSMAMELCETITQSPQKLAMLGRMYEDYKAKAVKINAIEAGSTEPDPTDTKMSRNPALETPSQPQQQQNQPQGRQR
jgi:hypothetical protein